MSETPFYRSLLFTPSKEKYLKKIDSSQADAVIVDFEDSIPVSQKKDAVHRFAAYYRTCLVNKDIFIRVNREYAQEEILATKNYKIKGYVIPKVEKVEDILRHTRIIEDKLIIALIETPLGVVNVNDIASSSYVCALAFGAEDYKSNYEHSLSENALIYPRSKLITVARAFMKPVYDSICLDYTNLNAMTADVEKSRSYGFNGKLAIHPSQIPIINSVFDLNDEEHMKYIVQRYDSEGQGVLVCDGRVYEKPHIDRYRKQLHLMRKYTDLKGDDFE